MFKDDILFQPTYFILLPVYGMSVLLFMVYQFQEYVESDLLIYFHRRIRDYFVPFFVIFEFISKIPVF